MIILILALSLVSVPLLPSRVHAWTCPLSYANYKIEGCVVNSSNTSSPLAGMNVYVIECGGFQQTVATTTDSNGHFSFTPLNTGCINPNQAYPVSANGVTPITKVDGCYVPNCNVLGVSDDNPTWGQWVGDVKTDGNGYASVTITLDPAQSVNVPSGALYSNTQFASMDYSMSQSSGKGVNIGVSLTIGGTTVSAGYESTVTETSTNGLTQSPNTAGYLGQPSYVTDYYCAGSSVYASYGWSCSAGLQSAGVSEAIPQSNGQPSGWSGYSTSEYISPPPAGGAQVLDCYYQVAQGQTLPKSFTWTTQTTNSLGISDTLSARGVSFTLSFTFSSTSGTSDTTGLTFSSTDGQSLDFRMYPAGGSCANPTFGSELHVWDMSPPPDYSMSANPSSLQISHGSSGSTTVSMTGVNGFNQQVSLTYLAPSGISVSLNPSSLFVSSATASSNVGMTVLSSVLPGSYTVTIFGSSGNIGHSVNIQVNVPDFGISLSPSSALVGPANNAVSTVTVTSVGGFTGTVNLGFTVSPSTGLLCSLSPTSVTLGSSGTSNLSCSGSDGSYTVTVTGTSGSTSHSTNFAVTVTDFTMSTSGSIGIYCNPYGCPYAESNSATLTITSISSWTGTVNLSYISPNDGSTLSGPSSVVLTSGSSVTVTLTGTPPSKRNTFDFWTIQGTNGQSTTSTTVEVYYWSCNKNCPIAVISGASTNSAPSPTTQANSTNNTIGYVYMGTPLTQNNTTSTTSSISKKT